MPTRSDTLDVPTLTVLYATLVHQPETEIRRIVEFLGLPWDDARLDFHANTRTVRTLSYDQVNKPLYTTSIGRHPNYAGHLDAVGFPAYAPPA